MSEDGSSLDEKTVSFVVIGLNEAGTLPDCLHSARDAALPEGYEREVIYVDSGSSDDSVALAREAGADRVIAGEALGRAARSRNRGLRESRGALVQFLDGDMTLHEGWIPRAMTLLKERDDVVAVTAEIEEVGEGLIHRVLEIDWARAEGEIPYVGGAAFWRAKPLREMGGFPEDVRYGEEPYLCWRLRNERELRSYHLAVPMVKHDLGHRGFADYLRRLARVGGTYPEIAVRCLRHEEKLWLFSCVSIALWGIAWGAAVLVLAFGNTPARIAVVAGAAILLVRKTWHARRRGRPWLVSFLYAVHTYFSKLPLAYGAARWVVRSVLRR